MKIFRLSSQIINQFKHLWLDESGKAAIPCPPVTTLHSRQYVSPQVSFQTIAKNVGGIQGDIPLNIPIPARTIICVSRNYLHLDDSMYLSFVPLGLSNPLATAILPNGNENWLPFCTPTGPGDTVGLGYIFEDPLPPTTMYITQGQEAGGTVLPPLLTTFAISNSLKWWNLNYMPI